MNLTEDEIVQRLIEFALKTKYADIPQEVLEFAKVLILKTSACMLVGSSRPAGIKMANLIKGHRLPEDVGVIGCGFKTSLWEATFGNAFLAHAAELEDNRMTAWGEANNGMSWDITVIPLLFSLAEKLNLSGKTFIAATAVGLEVHARTTLFSADRIGLAFALGAIGPAVTAARVMGLVAKEVANAIGLAIPNSHGTHVNFGTDGHFVESSHQALQGIIAAEMAKQGMTGGARPISYITEVVGRENINPRKMVQDLGNHWLFCEATIKKYPVCFPIHRHIDALIALMEEHRLSYNEVAGIEAETAPCNGYLSRLHPATEGDLQFSFENALGAAILDGDVNLSHIDAPALTNARLAEARSKVKIIFHNDWDCDVSQAAIKPPVRITVVTKDGRRFAKDKQYIIGSPKEPLNADQVQKLFLKFTKGIIRDEYIVKIKEALLNLEKVDDLQKLMDMLVFGNIAKTG